MLLGLEVFAVIVLIIVLFLLYRHLMIRYGSKDSNYPLVQRTTKMPPPAEYQGYDPAQFAEFGTTSYKSELMDQILDQVKSPITHQYDEAYVTPKEKRKRLFKDKADFRRAIIIDELLNRREDKEW